MRSSAREMIPRDQVGSMSEPPPELPANFLIGVGAVAP
jgi:hypothetical protein